MVKVILINKNGVINEKKVNISNLDSLYKKCGFVNNNYFDKHNTWKHEDEYLSLYGKNNGRANTENKYDLPPPSDNLLFFGTLMLVKHKNENININDLLDLSKEEWETFYEKSFGGFESLGEEDSSEDELENVPEEMKTKDGYLKDGFVVDTPPPVENSESDESDESDEGSYPTDNSSDDSELNSDDELSEESYLSDE